MGKILFILTLLSFKVVAADLAVSPLMIELKATAGAESVFDFTVLAKSTANIRLTTYDMLQKPSGHMDFVTSDVTEKNSSANWIKLEQSEFVIQAGNQKTIKGSVKLPRNSVGSKLAAIMVEEVRDNAKPQGIKVFVRYAVILNIDVQGRQVRPVIKTSTTELSMVRIDDEVFIEGWFTNMSSAEGWLDSEVQVRNAQKRLVDRVVLKTESAWQRSDEMSRVFPGVKVRLFGKISKELAETQYAVMVRNRFAGKMQPVVRQNLDIKTLQLNTTN